jgi:hypothetical protein
MAMEWQRDIRPSRCYVTVVLRAAYPTQVLVFFDEAGDPGMAGKLGQSPIFLVAVVLFEDHDAAEKADARIGLIRQELFLTPNHEFKFHNSRPNVRRHFLEQTLAYNWFYLVVAINKKKLYSPTFQSPEMFYNYSTSLVFENAKPQLNQAIVVIDKSSSKGFRHELSRYLRAKIDTAGTLIKKIKHEDSKRNNLLQLADMVAGAVYRSMLVDKKDRFEYRRIIRAKELRVQVWPR